MGHFEFVIALVAICVFADVVHKALKRKNNVGIKQKEIERLLATVESLEQRMQTVEEIVSSPSFDLRQQFDQLQQEAPGE